MKRVTLMVLAPTLVVGTALFANLGLLASTPFWLLASIGLVGLCIGAAMFAVVEPTKATVERESADRQEMPSRKAALAKPVADKPKGM